MNKYFNKKSEQKSSAVERITSLFNQAESNFDIDSKLSDRYVSLARKIAAKNRVRIPSAQRRRFCRHCSSFLVPSKNCRIRTREGMIVVYCLNCGHFNKFVYRR